MFLAPALFLPELLNFIAHQHISHLKISRIKGGGDPAPGENGLLIGSMMASAAIFEITSENVYKVILDFEYNFYGCGRWERRADRAATTNLPFFVCGWQAYGRAGATARDTLP